MLAQNESPRSTITPAVSFPTSLPAPDQLTELPTISESGLPGYNASGWYGLFVPAATPKPIIARLHQEAVKALRMQDVVRTLSSQGAEPVGNTPEEFGVFVKAEIEKWSNLVKVAKMKMD